MSINTPAIVTGHNCERRMFTYLRLHVTIKYFILILKY